jgi:hypothetical protein
MPRLAMKLRAPGCIEVEQDQEDMDHNTHFKSVNSCT